jgi:hypothetical protein
MYATLLLVVALAPAGFDQPPSPPDQPPPGPASDQKPLAPPAVPSQTPAPAADAGQGYPARTLRATATRGTATVQLNLLPNTGRQDIRAGLLVSAGSPDYRIVPELTVSEFSVTDEAVRPVEIVVSGLVPFGEMTVPILYQGKQVETIRFLKPGLIVRAPAEGPIVADEDVRELLLVLENASAEEYTRVGIRVRFQDVDVCNATGDQPTARRANQLPSESGWWARLKYELSGVWGGPRVPRPLICSPVTEWASFQVRPNSQVSLWVPTPPEWYVDRQSGLARSAARKGIITLRFFDGDAVAAEQNLPVEVQFEPTTGNLWASILWIAFLLLCGAVIFLTLRVSIPNYRLKKQLKAHLNDTRTATSTISDVVDSQLRVLVRVERLILEQRRREGWVLLPGFDELARRIEAGLTLLNRKVGFVQRLDTITCRREALVDGPVAPTRLDILDREANAACEGLKADQLGEPEWLFVQQRLEAADKVLNEPSPEEKQAFEALLAKRWQVIKEHFGVNEDPATNTVELKIPPELSGLEKAFPRGALLPRIGDDGVHWIASAGVIRADLQLTALELVREVQFLMPRSPNGRWQEAVPKLADWLATPAIANIASARQLIRQLAEYVTETKIVEAIRLGEADIVMDPQEVAPNQTVRLAVRFREARINGAAARAAIRVVWYFDEPSMIGFGDRTVPHWPRLNRIREWLRDHFGTRELPPVAQTDTGWRIYRYFEPLVKEQKIAVRFFYEGSAIEVPDSVASCYQRTVTPRELAIHKKEGREKWFRFWFQTVQMLAALLVPLATLAVTTAGEPSTGRWWDIVGIGFGSEAIRNILTGEQTPPSP